MESGEEEQEEGGEEGGEEEQEEGGEEDSSSGVQAVGEEEVPEQKSSAERRAPPTSLSLSRPTKKKKILVAPALSLSLGGRSESSVSGDFPSCFLSPSPEDDDDLAPAFDLDDMDTPSDSESLPFPMYDLEDDLRRLGVATQHRGGSGSRPRSGSDCQTGSGPEGGRETPGSLEQEDVVDGTGTRWRRFSTGDPPQESRVDMSVLEPFLRVLSHAGYYGDGTNDIIVFSSCFLPQNHLENYGYVMDHLFRYVVGTLDLMVQEDYVVVYLCAGGQEPPHPRLLPSAGLAVCLCPLCVCDCVLRKNLKGFYVVHPTWYIKALVTIIKPFISSKFSRKLQFVSSLCDLSHLVPTEHVQIPDCVARYDQNLSS
ncbi:bcl-2/adenovirus E1B 19 kDa-interacting protein 2-like protein [Pseudoliparis swirei]|uniref:bcl-2/adenovirus E1B 19 kDa-interacting protein 2-like protein n=1 Tax=Pseudoliparis swirei TaxID=2059687 RepID=UPI0024BEC8F0|nr:bcl-2/adenovirus E1B 19 kDa-interacting protein 2-like protein [Pseudoliparis swirei]